MSRRKQYRRQTLTARLTSGVAALVMTVFCALPGAAVAAPGDDPDDPGSNAWQVGLNYFGASSTLTLPGQSTSQSLTVAVPDGTTPTALTGIVALPSYVTSGTIDVWQQDRLLSRTAVPTAPNAPITLGLGGVAVDRQKRAVDLTLRTQFRVDGYCTYNPDESFRITGAQARYSGQPTAPTAVADFLPPILTALTVYIPSDVRPDEGAAAVRLAAAAVAHYGTAPLRVQARALPRSALTPPRDDDPLHRQIVIADDLPDGYRLTDGGRYLTVGGPDLAGRAGFLTSDLAELAAGSAAVPGPDVPAPQLPRDVSTLAGLGVGDQQVTAGGWPSLTIGIDQTRLGRPSKDVRIQLRGTYTPPPAGVGGQVVVTAGDTVVASWAADAQGTFDRWVDVPNNVLARFTTLRVTVQRGDLRAGCGDGYLSTLSLSSNGEVQSSAADPPAPPGFGSVPQSLMPRTQLAWTRGDAADVSRAVSLAAGMQRLSSVPLGLDVVGKSSLDPNLPAILIAADGTGLSGLTLPVSAKPRGAVEVTGLDKQPAVTNIPNVAFGSLQVVRRDGQTVLVATSTAAPDLLDDALAWLDDDPDRWSSLTGTALLQARGRTPVLFTSPAATPPETDDGLSAGAKVGVVLGILVVVAAAGAAALLTQRRRRTRDDDPADRPADD
ncbi:MAG: hypothetical protein QM658_10230 [Gordonia sp. (in: high G+C Gram-positive bacteria)]